ncbi:FliH/SctL family protein [Qipengyuania nanhaisediminis]|uniref:FliH/SctL family protein n=1 Tax=Qipengyuania nanhaisediminis TaxID=604088 RepID=UPI0038B25BD0
MANSSDRRSSGADWVAALQGGASGEGEDGKGDAPGWVAQMQAASSFVEGFPARTSEVPVASMGPSGEDRALEASAETDTLPAGPADSATDDREVDPLIAAFERGRAEGQALAEAELRDALERQRRLRLNFNTLDQAAMDSLAAELAATVTALCGEVITDYKPEPAALEKRCKAAAARLGEGAAKCALHLHPADLDQLDSALTESWRVVPDETIERGALRFEGADGAVSDGPAEWRRAIAAAIAG